MIQNVSAGLQLSVLSFHELLLKIHEHLSLLDLEIHELFQVNFFLLRLSISTILFFASLLDLLGS